MDGEFHVIEASAETKRQVNRLSRRSAHRQPRRTCMNAEQYRAWLLDRVDALAAFDVTEAEHAETCVDRATVLSASVEDLWSDYTSQVPPSVDSGRVHIL
ncbi:hypothetical protein [Microbacterium gorillae]|uniref:hypothetical protein n=1 Tax=Microbacterium gorillae TaxID=1231063 RepID=UPI003D950FF5